MLKQKYGEDFEDITSTTKGPILHLQKEEISYSLKIVILISTRELKSIYPNPSRSFLHPSDEIG